MVLLSILGGQCNRLLVYSFMQNINDLLNQYKQQSKHVSVTTSAVEEQLEDKMHKLALQEKEKEAEKKAYSLSVSYIHLVGMPIPPDILTIISKEDSQRLQVVAFFANDESIRVGATDPSGEDQKQFIDLLEKRTKKKVVVYLITQNSFEKAFALYANVPVFRKVDTDVTISEEDFNKYSEEITDFRILNEKIKEVNITDVVTLIIASSLKSRASDIHIEAEEAGIKVRFRIDGVLHDVADMPRNLWPKVISRIKLLAKLKINITSQPQDGRITIVLSEDKVDVRVSALPTAFGESVVMRLLKSTATTLQFDDLGIRGAAYEKLKTEAERPNGMIVTTGPTGSGKTTTLYAILNKLNTEETKIITLEDPIEYKLAGVNQSQIDHSKGYTFADGLRSILRQDPDVIMVGELRDLETADVAINASLTGHLVISTLHTNSAAGAIPRFMAMGVKPFLLAPSLNAIIGQRLVRRVCEACKQEDQLAPETLERVKQVLLEIPENSGETVDMNNLTFYKGGTCEECNGLGYKGRIGIYEILIMNKEVENIILSGQVSEYDMQEIGVKNGMVTMVQDGMLKALAGITSVEEVFRVTE